jgi:SulP family sulfate permease
MKNLFSNIKGDAFGGITAGIVALPLALAFGVTSGLGPSAGLYGAIFLSFFAAFFGGTPTQISGPTAPMTAVSLVVVGGILATNDGNIEQALPIILAVFLLAGLFQIVIGVAGIGKYIKYIPYPVVSGFMTAIGVMILITQILPAIGYYPKEDADLKNALKPQAEVVLINKIVQEAGDKGTLVVENSGEISQKFGDISKEEINTEAESLAKNSASGVVGTIKTLPQAIGKINYLELILTLLTILIIYGFKRITTAIPSQLVALLAITGVAYFAGLNYRPIDEIPSGFPQFNLGILTNFSFAAITPYIFAALSLAFLGAIDSLLTSVVADNMTKTKHNPNQELVGQGIGNSISALFGGLPGAGATIRTVININSGGKTRLSGMIAGVFLLIILLGLSPAASKIPAAVLAGILITVGIGVMDYKGLRAIPSMPKDVDLKIFKFSSEVLVMFIVLVLAVVWDLVSAVGIGLVLSSVLFMKKMGDFTADESRVLTLQEADKHEEFWLDETTFPPELSEEVFIKHLNGPLFFGYTSEFQILAKQIPATASHLILRMDKVPYMDQTGLYALEDILLDLESKDVHTLIIAPQKQPLMMLRQIDIVPDLVSEEHIFDNFQSCIKYINENVENKF